MNAVEFLSNHRVVVNRHARGAPLPHLTDSAIQSVVASLDKGQPFTSIPWRGRGGGQPSVSGIEFDRQLDKVSVWLDQWAHSQRCQFLEELLNHSSFIQSQLLYTVLQPSLHRDFMYTVRSRFPDIDFTPVSTSITRELKDKLTRLRLDTFHRAKSAHIQRESDVDAVKLPELSHSFRLNLSSVELVTSSRKEKVGQKEALTQRPLIEDAVDNEGHAVSQDAVSRFAEMTVRRHIQDDEMSQKCCDGTRRSKRGKQANRQDLSSRKAEKQLPVGATEILTWYTDLWNDTRKNEFFHKLLLKLDPRQHYFLSSYLSVKHHKDIISLLPADLALRILSYLTPRELLVAARVSRTWNRLANTNSLWKLKCDEIYLEVPVPPKPTWKSVYKDNLYLRYNWNKGLCRVVDFRGHTQSVLCVTCDLERLASGSSDKTIKVWNLKTGALVHTLKGHAKGVWCLQFFTKHLLISGSFDSTIRIWNLRTGQATRTLLGHGGQVWCLKLHHGRGLLVSGSQDRTAKIWDIGRCYLQHTLYGHNAAVFAVDFSEDGDIVVTGSADRSVRLWTTDDGQCRKVVWVSQTTSIMTVSYSQGYFACSYDGVVCLYRGGKLIKTFSEHRKRVESVNLRMTDADKGEGYIVSAGKDNAIKYWDCQKDHSTQTFEGHKEPINCIYVNQLCIASAGYDHKIRVWDFNIGMPPKELLEEEEDDNNIMSARENGVPPSREIR